MRDPTMTEQAQDAVERDVAMATDDYLTGRGQTISTQTSALFVKIVAGVTAVFLVWAATAKLDQVTRGGGRIVSQEKNKVVQHLEGGIISQILVQEGQKVAAGEILLRIENSFAEADLEASLLELATQRLKENRLRAEAAGAEAIAFDAALAEAHPRQVGRQRRVFESRRAELTEKLKILNDQVAQKELELSEKRSRLENKRRERALMSERLTSLRKLSKQGAVARNELLQNETLFQQLVSQVSDLEFQVPQTQAALEEARGRRREAELSFRSAAERELSDAQLQIAKLVETIEALRDRNRRFDVTAPTAGTINKLFVNTINGVVRPGQNIAEIVSDNASIEVEAKLSPRDRARVWPGLPAIVKVSAYDYATHGGLRGRIVEVSPDALRDDDGRIYFRVRIEAEADALGEDNPVVPGMLAEVDIITGKKTILDYLLKPVRNIQEKALRE
ncbi:MAG: HlyD family type I secretion periplasmic adaptor subunit [Pseudomonadota bacterium]